MDNHTQGWVVYTQLTAGWTKYLECAHQKKSVCLIWACMLSPAKQTTVEEFRVVNLDQFQRIPSGEMKSTMPKSCHPCQAGIAWIPDEISHKEIIVLAPMEVHVAVSFLQRRTVKRTITPEVAVYKSCQCVFVSVCKLDLQVNLQFVIN